MDITTVNPAVDPTPPDSGPTITKYQQIASEVFQGVLDMRAKIPELESPHPESKSFVDSMRSVPRRFLETTIGQVQQIPEYQGVNRLDVPAAQADLQYIDALTPFSHALRTLQAEVEHTIAIKYARVAKASLQIYYLGKGLARDPNASHLTMPAKILSEALGRTGVKRTHKPQTTTSQAALTAGVVITGKESPMEH